VFRRHNLAKAHEQLDGLLDEGDRVLALQWWHLAKERLQTGRVESWLTGNLMLTMAIGFAVNSGTRVLPVAYSLPARAGYALRMFVDRFATPEPLDVSTIDRNAIATLAGRPRDPDLGVLSSDLSADDEELLAPIVMLVSDTAEQSDLFAKIVAVEPAFWNGCVSIVTYDLHRSLQQGGYIRRARDLDAETAEAFLRYGFVLRALDEALGIETPGDEPD
jgi:hypothetical protein